jgi:hypothetical protein
MATRKGSNKSTPSTKKVLGKSTAKSPSKKNSRKPAKKNTPKKVDDELVNKGKKRKAKRKQGFVPLKEGSSMEVPSKVRKKSAYNVVSSAISKWCKENGARCTKKQISDIYQGLKERRLTGDPKYQLTAEDIELGIKGELVLNEGKKNEEKVDLLAFKNDEAVPLQFLEMDWFNAPSFFNNDGLFFKKEDILRFDLTSIGRGVVEVYYSEFNKVYRDEIYVWVTQDIEDYEKKNGQMLSPVPKLILNEQMTDIENRIFEWTFESDDLGIDLGATQEGQQKVTGIKNESLPTEAEAKAQKQEDIAREKQESAPSRKLSKKELEIKKIEAETENLKEQNRVKELMLKEKESDREDVKMGLMTSAEFRKKWKGK